MEAGMVIPSAIAAVVIIGLLAWQIAELKADKTRLLLEKLELSQKVNHLEMALNPRLAFLLGSAARKEGAKPPVSQPPTPTGPEAQRPFSSFRTRRGWKAERERVENRVSKGEKVAAQLEAAETGNWPDTKEKHAAQ